MKKQKKECENCLKNSGIPPVLIQQSHGSVLDLMRKKIRISMLRLPAGAEELQGKEKLAEPLKVDFEAFKKYLINHN